ncbi:MAG: T9SS type A sorting domain-containing protein [Bacteroidota bacterium]
MKNFILILIASVAIFFYSFPCFSQLSNGSVAPNFTLNDLDGNQQNLYSYLDQGKTVYIDFFACHCPYCWAYHNTHALRDLNNEHGIGTSSDDIRILAIELDANNGVNEFQGISGVTQGNWLEGSNYPFLNPEGNDLSQIKLNYAVNYYPLIYAICPDRTITVIGTQTATDLYNHVSTCDNLASSIEVEKEKFKIYYASEKTIIIELDENQEQVELQILDLSGKIILKNYFDSEKTTIDILSLKTGIYILNCKSENTFYSERISVF